MADSNEVISLVHLDFNGKMVLNAEGNVRTLEIKKNELPDDAIHGSAVQDMLGFPGQLQLVPFDVSSAAVSLTSADCAEEAHKMPNGHDGGFQQYRTDILELGPGY